MVVRIVIMLFLGFFWCVLINLIKSFWRFNLSFVWWIIFLLFKGVSCKVLVVVVVVLLKNVWFFLGMFIWLVIIVSGIGNVNWFIKLSFVLFLNLLMVLLIIFCMVFLVFLICDMVKRLLIKEWYFVCFGLLRVSIVGGILIIFFMMFNILDWIFGVVFLNMICWDFCRKLLYLLENVFVFMIVWCRRL